MDERTLFQSMYAYYLSLWMFMYNVICQTHTWQQQNMKYKHESVSIINK